MKKKSILLICSTVITGMFLVLTNGCKEQAAAPSVTTAAITDITEIGAISGGSISDEGSSVVYQKGVCWSTGPEPTIADNITDEGDDNSSFTSEITGLNNTTTYYVRAYAKNSDATGYGNQLSFVATPATVTPPCSPAQNYIRYHLENHTYGFVYAGTSGLLYGDYGLVASGSFSDLSIEFTQAPISGKYITHADLQMAGAKTCNVSGTFGGTFSYHYVATEGDTVYVTKNGPDLYSITFCDLHFNGTNGDTFDSDGNLTTD